MAAAPLQTRFFELSGSGAEGRLRRLAVALERDGARVTLLASRDRAGLYLLVAEGELPDAPPPEGCKVWTFERLPS